MAIPFVYDEQIRRYLLQIIRLFDGYQVRVGKTDSGQDILQRVPVRYGDSSRQAAAILKNNSESSMNTVPMMSVYISDLRYDRERVQNPSFVSKMHIRERAWDEESEEYLTTQGNAFTIERIMPAPYTLGIKLDIWTSNTDQKLQLMEQILPLYNPDFEIQSTDNYIDWTSLSLVRLLSTNWGNKSIPVGADDSIEIHTLTFEVPIWISLPVKVKKLGVIQKIIAGIYDAQGNLETKDIDDWMLLGDRSYITVKDYGVLLNGNTLTLLKYQDSVNSNLTKVGTRDNWRALINLYGKLNDGVSQVRLLQSDGETEVVGTVAFHPNDDSILLFTVDIDTIPVNTLPPIDAIIDPQARGPGSGLPVAAVGQRYLLTKNIGDQDNTDGADAWKGVGQQDLVANSNDIIAFDGNEWVVAFDSNEVTDIEYLSNLASSQQYKWTGSRWMRSYEGEYKNSRFRIVL
jgi:hypothetical protein